MPGFDTYYGPTVADPDPAVEYHRDCPEAKVANLDGVVLHFKEGAICSRCGQSPPDDEDAG